MITLTNTSKQLVAVTDSGERKEIAPRASIDVSSSHDWKEELFVKAGWLVISSREADEPELKEPKPESAPESKEAPKAKNKK